MNGLNETSRVHFEDLTKAYGDNLVLDDIDLSIAPGALVSLVGPSGCGKSTMLRLVLGQELPTSGVLDIDQEPVGFPDRTRGVVYQHYSLLPNLTALENVMLGPKLVRSFRQFREDREEIRAEAVALLERVGLGEHLDHYPHELSGGQRQRVAIVQSFIMRPQVLLMDEPFGALDPGTRESMQALLLELWEETGMTIILVTHDPEEAVYLASRLIVLSQHYTDARGADADRGARIVRDYDVAAELGLEPGPRSTTVKELAVFGKLVQRVKRHTLEPSDLQHVTEFDLRHPRSFMTLDPEVSGDSGGDTTSEA